MDSTYYTTTTTTTSSADSAIILAAMMPFMLIGLLVALATIIGIWKMFEKANVAGWKAIIPFYNNWIQTKLGGSPWWYFLLLFVPAVNTIAAILININFAKAYGKDVGWGVLAAFFPFVVYPMLGFDKKLRYMGPQNPIAPAGSTPTAQATSATTTQANDTTPRV